MYHLKPKTMKKQVSVLNKILWVILFFIPVVTVHSQSAKTIFLQSGEQIDFEKIRVRHETIRFTNVSGDQKMLNTDDIHFIIQKKFIYLPTEKKGRNIVRVGKPAVSLNNVDPGSMCTLGLLDGMQNDFAGAKIGGGITGFLLPLGLVGTAIIASSTPQEKNLHFPDTTKRTDPLYMECYMKAAKDQRKTQTWMGATIGGTVALIIVAVASASAL